MWEQKECRQSGEKSQVLSGLAQPTCPDRLPELGCAPGGVWQLQLCQPTVGWGKPR